ncbi:MAG: hypothetical protein BMS9Abin07_0131 [Acidimicrobiia bacterium]|nr:MAG: hypothetical protein BMS9Abin07_0131 [Acidimicrobiia bacterium]
MLAATIVVGVLLITRPHSPPALRFDETVPDDLRTLATGTWQDFLTAHRGRQDCFPPVALSAAWELDDRAEYRPGSATVLIRVPGTAANLRRGLIHEFAHHVEFTCPEHAELRPEFLAAQGFPASTDWFGGDGWETTPSEQYAEATVEVVLGRRAHHGGIVISDEAVAIVRRWGSGS